MSIESDIGSEVQQRPRNFPESIETHCNSHDRVSHRTVCHSLVIDQTLIIEIRTALRHESDSKTSTTSRLLTE